MKNITKRIWSMLLALCLPWAAGAQDTLISRVQTLGSVSVRGTHERSFQKLTSVEQTEVITQEGLRGLACCNLGDSFENSASVDVGYADAITGTKQIQLLGLTSVYSQMMLENIPLLRGIASSQGLGYVPGQWLQSISVSKGTGTVKYGYESITGTINLEYEKPDVADPVSINLFANSDLKSEITAKFNLPINEKLSTGLYLFGGYNGYMPIDRHGHDGYMDVPMQTQLNAVNRWSYHGDNGWHSLTLLNVTHEDRLGGHVDFTRDQRGSTSVYGFGCSTNRVHFFTKNGIPLNDKSSIGTHLSGTYHNQQLFYGLSDYNGTQKDFYANLLYETDVAGFSTLGAGASFRYSDIEEQLLYRPYLMAQALSNDSLPWGRLQESVAGAYGEYTFKIGTLISATAGLRYDYNSGFGRHLVTPRLNVRWEPVSQFIIRASAGRGFRAPNLIADNFGIMASSRTIHVVGALPLEESWNGGINLNKTFALDGKRKLKITADYYRTQFVSQLVAYYDQDPNQVWFYALDGKSYSNVIQLDVNVEPLERFDITLAGKYNDVKCTYNGQLMDKPYTSKWKGLLVLSYHTPYEKWRFDLTTQLNGPQRLPKNVSSHQGYTSPYVYMLGQVTRKFKNSELYVGVENLTNYVQHDPIAGFDQPFTTAFDASVVYAPLMGRMWYIGFRYTVQ